MRGASLRKALKDVDCEEWGWVSGRVVSLCNIDVTEVTKFGSFVSARTQGAVAGTEGGRNSNIMTTKMSKALSKSIYINHHFKTSVNNN